MVRWCFATFFHWKFPEIMTKPPVLSSFSRRRDSGFARIYIYIYTHIISHTHIYIHKRDIYIYKPIYKHVFNWPFHVQPWRLFCLRQPGLANSLRPGPGPGNKFTYCIEPLDYTIHIIRCLTIGFGDTPNINCVCIYIYTVYRYICIYIYTWFVW